MIGGGTGDWDVPVGGMGALTDALARGGRRAGAELVTGAEVTAIDPAADGRGRLPHADGERHRRAPATCSSRVAPQVLGGSARARAPEPTPAGARSSR